MSFNGFRALLKNALKTYDRSFKFALKASQEENTGSVFFPPVVACQWASLETSLFLPRFLDFGCSPIGSHWYFDFVFNVGKISQILRLPNVPERIFNMMNRRGRREGVRYPALQIALSYLAGEDLREIPPIADYCPSALLRADIQRELSRPQPTYPRNWPSREILLRMLDGSPVGKAYQ